MNETGSSQSDANLKALEDFVAGNEDPDRLEAPLNLFNIFEAIRVIRQELRDSDFLAFLPGPRGNRPARTLRPAPQHPSR